MKLTEEQLEAVERRDGSLMVRAGAGTGKTTVLVERFVRAVVDDAVPVESMLAITFTDKAAAEMRTRVRRRLLELGRREEARAAESASISTIHGFCSRLLRAHALRAGIDPDFRLLEELESERLAVDAFDRALEDFLGVTADADQPEHDPDRLEMVASYTPDSLRDMVRAAHAKLRSRGERRPALEASGLPEPAGERERLEPAARTALAELSAGPSGVQVARGIERLQQCLDVLEGLAPDALAEPGALGKLRLTGSAKALCTPVCEEYGEALLAFTELCVARREHLDRELLRRLLDFYTERYEEAKRERSALDFEDLQLLVRDLLVADAGLREHYSTRYEHVFVDEYQDVNPLQSELIELIAGKNLFRVGDENQSIYGFRHADVSVFRNHRERAVAEGRAASITVNFRTRGEVLDAIDLAFERTFGEDFEPLREAPGARGDGTGAPSVEVLAVHRDPQAWEEVLAEGALGSAMEGVPAWRALEARLLAKRIDELTRTDEADWGDVVVLLRATTSMSVYERALEERGVPTHVVGGRGYWSQQQVLDLRHWLAALANPLDELSLYSVLGSPLVGLGLDSVALVARCARRERKDPLWAIREALEQGQGHWLAQVLPPDDWRRLGTFLTRFDAERRAATRVALETLIDRAVTSTGYDRHLLSLHQGERRMANVRKLMRMAREFEADEGRDLRGFIDAVTERDAIQTREGEAPLEGEALNAVRLMTIHRAKGLEFPVVAVADLGKLAREDDGRLRISADGDAGLRLASIGGGVVNSPQLDRIKKEQKTAGEAEERRIFYVAATRAQRHLILSGATNLETRPQPDEMQEPMRWIWRGFCPGVPDDAAFGIHLDRYDGREVRVAWQLLTPATAPGLLPAADLSPGVAAPAEPPDHQQPELALAAVPAPRALPVSRISYSGLEAYRRCSYRFYLERALRLRPVESPVSPEQRAAPGLGALVRGSLVHQLLEELDFQHPRVPDAAEVEALVTPHAPVRTEDVEDLRAMVAAFTGSELFARVAAARRVRSELPFAFTLEPPGAGGRRLVVNGVVDVYATEADGALVVDYKSDALDGRDPEELCARSYATQRLVYALAALRSGASRVEVVHCFLERPDDLAVVSYGADEASGLEAQLLEVARGVVEARFEPTASPHRELCGDCPGRASLCSWGPEQTLAEPALAG